MGVLGLWQLLAPVGQPVTLESLENKIFAVDISIWLNQALKGYRDSQGGSIPNAHLLSLFSRLCKLLFYKIRPIIVFDGGFPELKKQTIINRQQRKAIVKQSSRDIGLKILTNYIASQNLAIGNNEKVTAGNSVIRPKEKIRDEIYKLPPLPNDSTLNSPDTPEDAIEWKFTNFSKEDIKYLNKIDIDSEDFNNLPPDVKQEILSTLKESRKHRTWEQSKELPEDSNEFSSYQMQCLLKKRSLSRKLEEVQKDMRKINAADFVAQYTSDHVLGETNKIMSDDCSHYVLLKKIMKTDKDSLKEPSEGQCSSMIDTKSAFIKDMENIDVFEDLSAEIETVDVVVDLKSAKGVILASYDNCDEDVDNPPISIKKEFSEENNVSQSFPDDRVILSSDDDDDTLDFPKESNEKHMEMNVASSNTVVHAEQENSTELTKDCVQIVPPSYQDLSEGYLETGDSVSSSDDEMIPCEELSIENQSIFTSQNQNSLNKAPLKFEKNSIFNSKLEGQRIENADLLDESKTVTCKEKTELSAKSDKINSSSNHSISSSTTDILEPDSVEPVPSTSSFSPSQDRSSELAHRNFEMQRDLETATLLLEADQAKLDRQNRSVQDHMIEECKELLRLFGIPFVVSPTEAEAQCAFYDMANLTHGTITDDSDVWLFGGKRVYKNFFSQQKYVEFYKDHEIFTHFGLSRPKLINFAMLTGSDYTEGIEGVGRVTAMEIISEFPGESIDALQKFKDWWDTSNKIARPPENKVRAKLLKLVLGEHFPDEKVFDAYLKPDIDESTEKFTWGRPDLDALRDYTKERFGWNKSKVDEALLPVIKKLGERDTQTHLDSFFTVSLKKQTELFPSKRIMSALKKIASPQKEGSGVEVKAPKRKPKGTAKKMVKRKAVCRTKQPKPQGPVLSEDSSDEE